MAKGKSKIKKGKSPGKKEMDDMDNIEELKEKIKHQKEALIKIIKNYSK